MESWKMLNRASAVTIAVSVVVGAVSVGLGELVNGSYSGTAAAAWLVVGLVSAAGLGFLTIAGERVLAGPGQLERYRAILIVANLVWVSGLVAVTGGLDEPYWILLTAPLLIAAVSLPRWQSLVVGVLASFGSLAAFAVNGQVSGDEIAGLLLVLPAGPGIAWFVGMLCESVWAERRAAQRERDELGQRVDELSAFLAQAAEGDLAVRVHVDDASESVVALTESFNNTLGNLRLLVDQIRSGGQQITASAGELLATAEEH
ncbi:MAG: hypothetical protein ACRDV2_13450, partial [Actinomycetes bacterium]